MGLVYKEIEREAIVNALRARGYGEERRRHYALAVNKPTGRKYESGGDVREFAWGVTQEQLQAIQRYAENAEDAANRAEAAGLGHDMLAVDNVKSAAVQQPGLTMDVAEKLITNRVANEVSKAMTPVHAELMQLAKGLSEALALISATKPRKPGRPKGSKNKPKDEAPAS